MLAQFQLSKIKARNREKIEKKMYNKFFSLLVKQK